jgi:hypothetical protein
MPWLACTIAPTVQPPWGFAQLARRGADATLELMADHPAATTDRTFLDHATLCAVQRLGDVFGRT